MTIHTSTLLANIREAVTRRNWEDRNRILFLLLQRIEHQTVMEMAIKYAEWYLPRFIERCPTETWTETRVQEIRRAMTVGFANANIPEIFPEFGKPSDDPLARTFQNGAMYSLWAMIRPAADEEKSIEFARDAIAKILTVVLYEYREWVPTEFIKDDIKPDFNELELSLWFKLIYEVETLLNHSISEK